MAVDNSTEILKTLQRIEKALSNGSQASGLGRPAPRVAGGNNSTPNNRGRTRDDNNQQKAFRATVVSINKLSNASDRLNRSFTGLTKTVDTLNRSTFNTRSGFVQMNRQMRAFVKTTTTPPSPANQPTPANPRGGSSGFGGSSGNLNTDPWKLLPGVLGDFGRNLTNTIRNSNRPAPGNGTPGNRGNGPGGNRPRPPAGRPGPGQLLPGQQGPSNILPRPGQLLPGQQGPVLPPGGRLGGQLSNFGGKVGGATKALWGFTVALAAAIVPLTRDILMLHSNGIQASSALGGMYIDAARAGMSLKDYTKVITESSVAVTRSGSMADFNAMLQVSNRRLEGLGIFGAEATKLSASLATSGTALGIPQSQLVDATNAQIDVFGQLRKTSLLTADGFQKLTEQLASNQVVQSQLLGMAPAQRATRMNELIQIKTIGLSLGSTKAASDALGAALIDQRNQTAPKRFEAAGLVRQAGSMFGQDTGNTEVLARLARKKNLSPAEAKQASMLGAQLQAAIDRELDSGDVSREYRAEQMQEKLTANGFGKLMEKAGNVALTASSGPAGVNKDFAKGSSDLLIATGRLMAWTDGLTENTIVKALSAGVIGTLVGKAFTGAFGGLFRQAIPPAGGPAAGGLWNSIKGITTGAYDLLKSGIGKIFGLFNPASWPAWNGLGNFFRGIGTTLGGWFSSISGALSTGVGGLGKLAGGLLKRLPLLGALWDGIGELFSGNIMAAFNPDGKGGIAEVIGNVGFAIINGFTGSIGAAVDWVISFFSKDGLHVENALNVFGVSMKLGLTKALSWALDFLPGLGKASAYFGKSAADTAAVLNQLLEDNTSTVSSIGKQRNKEIEDGKKNAAGTKANADKVTAAGQQLNQAQAGILTSTDGIVGSLVTAAVATPVTPTQKTVTQATVNTPVTAAPATPPAADGTNTATPAPTTLPTDAIIAQLITMNAVLSQMLTAEQLQAAGIQTLASATGRPVFANNETKYKALQGNFGYGSD